MECRILRLTDTIFKKRQKKCEKGVDMRKRFWYNSVLSGGCVMLRNLNANVAQSVAQFGSAFGSGPKGRRFKSCHLDQKKAGNRKVSGSFLSLLHKTPSLALFSCNECATMRKGPKTMSCRAHHFTPNHIIFVPLPIFRPDKKRNNAKPLDKTNIICKNRIRFYDRRVKPLDYQI